MEALTQFFKDQIIFITIFNIVSFFGFLFATTHFFTRLPRDYWLTHHQKSDHSLQVKCLRNLLALPIFLLGLLMLVLPGQGLLTILLALIISDFNYKHRLMENITSRPQVRRSLDYIRTKMKCPPFEWPP